MHDVTRRLLNEQPFRDVLHSPKRGNPIDGAALSTLIDEAEDLAPGVGNILLRALCGGKTPEQVRKPLQSSGKTQWQRWQPEATAADVSQAMHDWFAQVQRQQRDDFLKLHHKLADLLVASGALLPNAEPLSEDDEADDTADALELDPDPILHPDKIKPGKLLAKPRGRGK